MQIRIEDQILFIELNDVATANAMSLQKVKILEKFLKNKDIRLIVCSNQGRVHCSGGNLKEYASLKKKIQGLLIHRQIRKVFTLLKNHSAFKLSLISGDCFGGGIEFVSCFDWVVAEPQVCFGFWQNKLALSFGWGGFQRLSQKGSSERFRAALVREEFCTSYEAQKMGLVDTVRWSTDFEKIRQQMIYLFKSSSTKSEIMKSLIKNEALLFEKLWWSKEHLAHLNKFSNHL